MQEFPDRTWITNMPVWVNAGYYLMRANRNFRIKAFDFYIISRFDFADTLLTVKGQVAQQKERETMKQREKTSNWECVLPLCLSLVLSLFLCTLVLLWPLRVFPNEVRKSNQIAVLIEAMTRLL